MENITNSLLVPALPIPLPLPPAAETASAFRRLNARELAWGEMLWKGRVGREFERSNEPLCSLARQYMRTNHSAQDLVADLFAEMLKWPLHKRRNIKNLGAYLRKAVKNRSINASKRQRPFAELDNSLLSENISPENNISHFEHDLDLEILLRSIAPRQAEAFRLFFAGFSHEEIVEAMQLDSIGASKTLVYRAKMKMKELYFEWTQPDPDDDGGGDNHIRRHRRSIVQFNRSAILAPEPSFEDILMFIEGTLLNRAQRQQVLQWIFYDNDSIDIISGLQKTIRHCHNRDIRLYFSTLKSMTKERLFSPFDTLFLWDSDSPQSAIVHYISYLTTNNALYNWEHNRKYPDRYSNNFPASPPTIHSATHHTFDTVRMYSHTLYGPIDLFSKN